MPDRDPLFPSRVLVLGATSSIAIATLRRLAAPNRHFMLVARNGDRLTAVAQDLLTRGALAVDGRETRVWATRDAADPSRIKATPVPEEVIARFQV